MSNARHERRRRRQLALAQQRGDHDARALWLLPRYQHRYQARGSRWETLTREPSWPDDVRVEVAHDGGGRQLRQYRFWWSAQFRFVRPVRPGLGAFPPAFADRHRQLCPLYLLGADRFPSLPYFWLVQDDPAAERRDGRDPDEHVDPVQRVAGDRQDLARWQAATIAYLSELDAVDDLLLSFWLDRGRRIPLARWRQRRAFRHWRTLLEQGWDRLQAASDTYRPMYDELTAAIGDTGEAVATLRRWVTRLAIWEKRTTWRLVRDGPDRLLLIRDDRGGRARRPGPVATGPLLRVAPTARAQRQHELLEVNWDEESVSACDTELARLVDELGDPHLGRTRSGEPMVTFQETTFATWCERTLGLDHRRLFAPDTLAQDRARLRAVRQRRPGRRRGTAGGSFVAATPDHDPTPGDGYDTGYDGGGYGSDGGGGGGGGGSDGGGGGGGGGGI